MDEVRLVRKFNCKKKIDYQQHLWLIFRVQLTYEITIIIINCIVTMSLRFHLSHLYTTQFWTSQKIASSNFGLALSSLIMIPYVIKFEQAKGVLVKDLLFTMILFHILICFIYSRFIMTISYVLFACVIGAFCIWIGSFSATIIEQQKLHREIMQIESDDRKMPKTTAKGDHLDQHEHNSLTESDLQEQI